MQVRMAAARRRRIRRARERLEQHCLRMSLVSFTLKAFEIGSEIGSAISLSPDQTRPIQSRRARTGQITKYGGTARKMIDIVDWQLRHGSQFQPANPGATGLVFTVVCS